MNMHISGAMPNISDMMGVRSTDRSTNATTDYKGPSFAESFRGVAQSANIQVADGNSAAAMNLQHNREEKLEKLFSFTEAEEEAMDESLARIKKMLAALKK